MMLEKREEVKAKPSIVEQFIIDILNSKDVGFEREVWVYRIPDLNGGEFKARIDFNVEDGLFFEVKAGVLNTIKTKATCENNQANCRPRSKQMNGWSNSIHKHGLISLELHKRSARAKEILTDIESKGYKPTAREEIDVMPFLNFRGYILLNSERHFIKKKVDDETSLKYVNNVLNHYGMIMICGVEKMANTIIEHRTTRIAAMFTNILKKRGLMNQMNSKPKEQCFIVGNDGMKEYKHIECAIDYRVKTYKDAKKAL